MAERFKLFVVDVEYAAEVTQVIDMTKQKRPGRPDRFCIPSFYNPYRIA